MCVAVDLHKGFISLNSKKLLGELFAVLTPIVCQLGICGRAKHPRSIPLVGSQTTLLL
ncbi:hypothetical protein PS726_00149 [Pseudomonas fluorescens]|nr:hypothetical protein PS726_00149 [Pseudomonas fluorescens]